MPNCFSLVRKSAPAEGPISPQKIDDEMRIHFGAKPDPDKWYFYWYGIIGFSLAMGKTFQQIRQDYINSLETQDELVEKQYTQQMIAIVDWLDNNFIADAWYQVGR